MGRNLRPYLPGVAFHITARLQGREPRFDGIEKFVAARIRRAPRRSDASLLAWAVMPNHLHLVAVQGQKPLSALMQPLLRSLALLVQRRCNIEGHVFERRFYSNPCLDPDYFRNAIAYVHLNGSRASLCATPDDFLWCSHSQYLAAGGETSSGAHTVIERALRVFASRENATLSECLHDYRAFLRWRCAMDEFRKDDPDSADSSGPPRPTTTGGDLEWTRQYATAAVMRRGTTRACRMDLRDLARNTIASLAPGMDLELLRDGSYCRSVLKVRTRFILHAVVAGHPRAKVAQFLNIDASTVSRTLTAAERTGR